jgi:hypothetical protein
LLQQVAIPAFNSAHPIHQRLSEFSRTAHEVAVELIGAPGNKTAQTKLKEIEQQVNSAAAQLWGLGKAELESVHDALRLLSPALVGKKKPVSAEEATAVQASLAM